MNGITNTFNNIYAGLNDFEQRTDNFVNYLDQKGSSLKEKYADVKEIYTGVKKDVEDAYQTVDTVCKQLDEMYKNTMSVFMHGIGVVDSAVKKVKGIVFPGKKTANTSSGTASYQQAAKQPIIQPLKKETTQSTYKTKKKQPQAPVVSKKEEKSNTLDDLVKDFKNKLRTVNKNYDVKIDVYENEEVIKSYALNDEEEKKEVVQEAIQNKKTVYDKKNTYLDSLVERVDNKYIENSFDATKLYNSGYNTKEIIRELANNGYNGIKNYNDITDMVAVGLNSGLAYTKEKYNNAIATKLGAGEQIINDYLSGKSYNEIKENLKKNTNGMNISDSSILRIMHGYEEKTGKKVVGKRNGNGKNNNKNKKTTKSAKGKSKKK